MWKTTNIVLTFLLCILSLSLQAQANIEEPEEVSDLASRYRNFNAGQETVEGWRIQIVATTERRKMDDYRAKFKVRFPHLRFTDLYKKPYYRLTTGACQEKLEILPLLYDIKRVFPSAFVVRDKKIKKEDLI